MSDSYFFQKVRDHRKAHPVDQGFVPGEVDQAAEVVTDRILARLPVDLRHAAAWIQVRAIIQSGIATAIRHTAYDPPPFPGD